jgi:hypothetical protein
MYGLILDFVPMLFLEKKIVILTMQKEDSGVGSGETFWSKCKISGKIP